MKTKLVKLLVLTLAVCTIFGMMVFSASGEETVADHPHTESTTHCACGGLGAVGDHKTCTDVTWTAWTNDMTTPKKGNYYLAEDVTISAAISLSGNFKLCLNGYTLTVTGGARAFTYVGADYRTLEICDCSVTQSGKITTANSSNQGGVVYFGRGKFCLYGGTLENTAAATMNGAVIKLGQADTTTGKAVDFRLYGGKICGTTTTKNGGSIYAKDGDSNIKLYLYGGTISGGSAADGGNIYVGNESLYLRGTTVSGGSATGNGGNIYCIGTMEMTAGWVYGGSAGTSMGGDNVRVQNSTGSLTMSGGTIGETEQTAENAGHNLSILNATFTMSGGNIKGLVRANATTSASVELSGAACITGAKQNLLISADAVAVTVGELTDEASIGVTLGASMTTSVFATATADPAGKVFSDISGYEIAYADGKLERVEIPVHSHCVCGGLKPEGHTCEDVVFQAWTADMETAPTEGNWYLEEDVSLDGITLSGDLNLCLHGHTWDAGSNKRAILLGTTARTLNVTDCGENGAITGSFSGAQGKLIYAQNGTVNLYGGTYSNTDNVKRQNGGVISLGYKSSQKTYAATLNVYSATLTGTLAQDGGVIHLSNGSQANLYSSTLNTGDSYRGAINVLATCGLHIQDTAINGTENKTGIWNCGTMSVSGNVAFNNCAPNVMVDYREGNVPTLDVSALNVTTPITLRRYEQDNVNDDAGVLAQNAAEAHLTMLEAYNPGYYLSVEDGNLYLNNYAVQSFVGADIVGGAKNLTEAMTEENGAAWYLINTDLTAQTIGKDTIIDLNGKELSDTVIEENVTVTLIDSTTDDYDCADGYGKLTVSADSKGAVATNVKTTSTNVGSVKHYVTIPVEGAYTAHRIYYFITSVSLKPTKAALGYKAVFQGDEVVRNAVTSYGYQIWVNDAPASTYAKEGSFANKETVTLRVQNIFSDNAAASEVGATAQIHGMPTVTLNIGGESLTLNGTEQTRTMKQVIEYLDANVADLDETQMSALQTMVNTFVSYMEGWATSNITAWEPAEQA